MAKDSIKQAERIAEGFSSNIKPKTTNTKLKTPSKPKGRTKTNGGAKPKTITNNTSSAGGNSQTIKQTVKAVKDLAKQNKARAERRQYNDFKKKHSEYKDITFENWKKMKSQVISNNKRKSDTSKTKIKRFTKSLQNEKIAEAIDNKYKRALKSVTAKDKYYIKLETKTDMYDAEEVKKDILNDLISTNSKKSLSSRIKDAIIDEYTELGSIRMNHAQDLAVKIKELIEAADPEQLDELLNDFKNLSEKEITEKIKEKSAEDYQELFGLFKSNQEIYEILHYDEQYTSYNEYMNAYRAAYRRVN